MNKIPCEVVQDLFPSYIDHLTSETTNKVIESHLTECDHCKSVLDSMCGESDETFTPDEPGKKEIDFLKKNRARNRKVIVTSLAAAVLIIFGVFFIRMYVIGDFLYGDWIACDVSVSGKQLVLDGMSVDSFHGISSVHFEEKDGVVTATTKAVVASPIHREEFHADYTAEHEIRQVRINDRILWDDGASISSLGSSIYETRHDYIGEMPANNRTANALGLSGYLGAYLNELETSEPPYGWKILLQDDIPEDRKTLMESDMESFAYVMLAVIGNLDRVTYEYTVDGKPASKSITAEDATAFFGQDIKDCRGSVRLLDLLLEKTGLITQ